MVKATDTADAPALKPKVKKVRLSTQMRSHYEPQERRIQSRRRCWQLESDDATHPGRTFLHGRVCSIWGIEGVIQRLWLCV
jgi:hypothetical protein